jgi:glycosyltransferase involved in cell wall biosynthesis
VRHVVLNALFLDPAASGGPETYLRGLAPALAAAHPETRFTIVTTVSGAHTLRADGWERHFGIRSLPCEDGQRVRRQAAEQVMLPALARRLRADVLHSLASVAPIRVPGVAHVITVHDVTFFRRQTFGAVTTWGMRQVVGRAARNADGLVTASRVARDEICDELGLDPMAFTVAHHGADLEPGAPAAPEAEVRGRYALDGARVVLCVATKRPHKNQEVLVRALAQLDDDVVLVLAGHPEPYDAQLRALAGSLGVTGRVRFADYVPAADLEALWRIAGCGAFPTLAEGFGIPVVEAMARGVGVAVSDIPVLREVGDDVPRYFDPHDPAAATQAIAATLADPQAGARGPARAARFTWAASADATWSAYERACASR